MPLVNEGHRHWCAWHYGEEVRSVRDEICLSPEAKIYQQDKAVCAQHCQVKGARRQSHSFIQQGIFGERCVDAVVSRSCPLLYSLFGKFPWASHTFSTKPTSSLLCFFCAFCQFDLFGNLCFSFWISQRCELLQGRFSILFHLRIFS